MNLRRRLALRYGTVVAICLVLLAALTYHEFVQEPHMFRQLGIKEPAGAAFTEFAEVLLYGVVPLIFALGWWSVRRSLTPIDELAREVERFDAGHLRTRLPRTRNRDEVDRLAASFNQMAERLEHSFRQIREFTLHASHELKTPLTVMRVQLETRLEEDKSLSPADVEWLECELDEVIRLSKIVDSLTLLTKGEAGLVTLERQPLRLDELVRESFDDTQILAEPQDVKVILGDCAAVELSGDRHRLRQLLLNLADNAVKYNRPGGSVTMALRKTADQAELEITNTGEGIPPELQARVFERFVRGDEARSRAIEGCGLGLAICRWIVREHGGTIAISSQPHQTTTATIRLPLGQAV
jgi:signal transduction histidine kinase